MKKTIATIIAFVPTVAFAQTITDVNSLTYKLTNLGNTFIEILIAFAVIWIIFNVVRFIMSGDEKRKEHQSAIMWGVLGLFIILSIWGLVAILRNTFRLDNTAPVSNYPQVQYPTRVP